MIDSFRFGDSYRISELCELVLKACILYKLILFDLNLYLFDQNNQLNQENCSTPLVAKLGKLSYRSDRAFNFKLVMNLALLMRPSGCKLNNRLNSESPSHFS